MLFSDPDYPHVVMSFRYRGFQLDLDQSEEQGARCFLYGPPIATGMLWPFPVSTAVEKPSTTLNAGSINASKPCRLTPNPLTLLG